MLICFDASIHTVSNYTQMVVEAIIEKYKNSCVKASGVKTLLESLDSENAFGVSRVLTQT